MHTTASDGRCDPDELVDRAARAGITTLGVTDHDTVAAYSAVAARAARAGIDVVPGIEISAVWRGLEVHILGYFFDPASTVLASFLERQRADRVDRLHHMAARLRELGRPVDSAALADRAGLLNAHAIGRPHLARALVEAGHATDIGDAFNRFLRSGGPAYVPRLGPSPFDAIRVIGQAGGLSSLAHPGSLGCDELIPDLVREGLGAIEAWHPDHSPSAVERYRELAGRHALAVSGGSDFHGDPAHGAPLLGTVLLPAGEYEALRRQHSSGTRHDHHHLA